MLGHIYENAPAPQGHEHRMTAVVLKSKMAKFKTYKRNIPRVEHLTVMVRDLPILLGVYQSSFYVFLHKHKI